MTDRELMRQALEALKSCSSVTHYPVLQLTIKALRERLAQTEQEPVAITITGKFGNIYSFTGDYSLKKGDKVYTTPPSNSMNSIKSSNTLDAQRTWVGLSTDEFKFIASKYLLSREAGLEYFQEEIEAKLKEKNT